MTEFEGQHQEKRPSLLRPREAFRIIQERRQRQAEDANQATEFGYDPDAVKYREDHQKRYGETDMGIQATVDFRDTRYRKAFDQAVNGLINMAKAGEGNTGWTKLEGESAEYGKIANVELPNGRRYEVINETRRDQGSERAVSIRADHNQTENPGGAYYFTSDARTGERTLEICGAHMDSVDQVMQDITQVVAMSANK